jgi:glycosyltransferase involved in cell wall biosynthesis
MPTGSNALSVIHVATSHTGGAGIAARRLNSELNSIGVVSSFYALSKKEFIPLVNEYELNRNFIQRTAGVMSRILSDRLINQSFFSIISAPGVSTKWLIEKVRREHAVLHIHNWFNLLTLRQFKKIISSGIPVVITLHDQRFMTGGCHTTLDCTNFHRGCYACPRIPQPLSLKIRHNNAFFYRIFKEQKLNLHVIAPSKFMQTQAKKSNLLQMQKIVFVPNVLSSQYLQEIKEGSHGRSAGGLTLGIASLNNKDWLKGSDIVDSLIKYYASDSSVKFEFLTRFDLGRGELFWHSIDCLLVPSRGDNSPNVIHEAKIRGIPVIASEVGGISELLLENFDMKVGSQNLNVDGFIEAIEVMRNQKIDTKQTARMIDNFKIYSARSIDTLLTSYRKLLDQSL